TGVSRFAVDGAGSVVELNAQGSLTRFAPGSTTAQVLADNALSFVVDGSGSVVELQSSGTIMPTSGSGGVSSDLVVVLNSPLYRSAPGSDTPQLLDTGVKRFVVDGSGAVIALDSLSSKSLTLPDGLVLSIPAGNLVRFAPGSTVLQLLDTNVSGFAVDGSGS